MRENFRKNFATGVLATVLSTTTLGDDSNNEIQEGVVDDTSSKVSSLLTPNNRLSKNGFLEIVNSSQNQCDLDYKNYANNLLFPTEVQTIGIDRMAEGFLGNARYNGLNVVHPPLVDIGWFERVYCAGTMRGFLAYSKKNDDRSDDENRYIIKEGVDAWMLPDELKKLGFNSVRNLTLYFDKNKIGQPDIVGNKELYNHSLLELGNYLKDEGNPGSMLFIYFNLSNYRLTVKEFNQDRISGRSSYLPNINTHQAMFLGNSYMQFNASEVKTIDKGTLTEFKDGVDSINFLADFIQHRGGYKSALTDATRRTILENIGFYHSLIDLEINGEKVDLLSEYNKNSSDRIKINGDDTIKISGSIFMDGFHDANSPNKYISDNNHVRTMFYFEFVTIGSYTPSELIEPSQEYLERKSKSTVYTDITDNLKITNLYYLKENETINMKLREAILRYRFGKGSLLTFSDEEVELMNKIQSLRKGSRERLNHILRLNSIREQKINSLVNSLSSQERSIFNREYQSQIYGLQMMGYLQNEGTINEGTTKINAPIPYFDTNGLNSNFNNYIDIRKIDLMNYYDKNNVNVLDDSCVNIFFYPNDNFGKIFTQLEQKLQVFSVRYPRFNSISRLDLLKRNKLIDLVIDKYTGEVNIDVTNQVIPSMNSVSIPLDLIDKVLEELLNESFLEEVKISDLDSKIINIISEGNRQDFDILAHILAHESYESGFPRRKMAKILFKKLENTFLSRFYDFRVSSHGDFQTRFDNLRSRQNSLKEFPDTDNIINAINYLEHPVLKEIINRRLNRFEDEVKKDLELVNEVRDLLKYIDYYNDEQKFQIGRRIHEIFTELFRFNDLRQINIVGKIVQSSLMLDSIHTNYYNLDGWLNLSGFSVDEILYNEGILERYKKVLLVINNRSEKTTLIGVGESYILRIFEALGDDIRSKDFPLLGKNIKDQIIYDRHEGVLDERFNFYIQRLNELEGNDDIRDLLINEINKLINSNYSANVFYELFKNHNLLSFLDEQGFDYYFLPTLEEFSNTGFRELFFDYAKNPNGRTPPKIYDFKKISFDLLKGFGALVTGIAGVAYLSRKRKKSNHKNKK